MAKSTTPQDDVALIEEYNKKMELTSKKQVYTQRSGLTLGERLDLPIAVLSLPIVGFLALLTGPFRARKQKKNPKQGIARSLLLHVGYSITRRMVSRLSPAQIQAVRSSTSSTYKLFTWMTWIKNQTIDFGDGTTGHWLGDPNAKNVLIWIHGGGWAVPANNGYFAFFHNFVKELNAAGKDIAVFVVAYTLAPKAVYPTQLRQSVGAVRYILENKNRKVSNVFLGGDSAGGNLAIAVLSHILHPHPDIKELKLAAGEELGGLTLLSPWTSLETYFPAFETEPLGDLIDPACAGPWAGTYLGGSQRDNYTDPRLAPPEWWQDLPVKHVLITAGGYEVLLPMIQDFARRFKEAIGEDKVEYFVGAGEAHVAPMFNLMFGDTVETEQGKRVKTFYREVVNNE